jgi:TOMM system kinase/cyclase fusion protein
LLEGEGDTVDFDAILEQVLALVQRQGRVSYRAIARRFNVEDAYLADLREEILFAYPHIREEEGRGLVWTDPPAPTAGAPPPDVAAPQGAASAVGWQASDAERQLTVLFCDLVDSTALASQLDPEDLREVIRAYQDTCARVIARFEGHIAQYLGDGLLVYFGYPQAHEDDARRAVQTGLDLVAAMGALNARLAHQRGMHLAVRIGIHTGVVVVGAMGGGNRHEQLALGATPNVAARIQGLAAPDTVAISISTFRLVQGYFLYHDLGTHVLKGLTAPVQVYRILGESAAQSHLDVMGATGLTPLVGRDAEVALLLERWAQSQNGAGQVMLLRGEAGIGKSRLVEVLRERVISEGAARMVFRCSPYHQSSALYPVIDHLQRFLQWQRDETPEAKFDMLERVLQTYRLPLEDVVPLFAALLSVPLPERYPPLNLTPQRQRQKTHEALVAWLLEEAERHPVLAVWEDLHWADPSTLDVLSLTLDQVSTAPIFTLLVGRPEFRPPWAMHVPMTHVTLTRLGRAQVEAMLTSLTGEKPLPTELVEQIIAKTDGVPLFVEELVKMILESGLVREQADRYMLTGPLPPLAIPSTLHDSLTARLDRLATARELIQLGAVLGREFVYELLQAVSPVEERALQQGLAQLVEAELVYQRGLPPHSRYVFKHALIQDAAYQSLLKSTRQQYHQRIAQVLETQFPAIAEPQPELVAHHYTEAGLSAQAIAYWQRAGQQASGRAAYVEAINHLTKGLALLDTLPDPSDRCQHELTLQITLGGPLIASKGFAAPEVENAYARARALCQQVGETPQLFPVLWGLHVFYLVRAELHTAREVAEQFLRVARRGHDPAYLLEAHRVVGANLFYLGAFVPARAHLEQGIALYDPQQHRSHAFLYGLDPKAVCLAHLGHVLWALGYPDQALQSSREALTLAQELSHLPSLAQTLNYVTWLHQLRQEWQAAQGQAEALMALSREQGFPYWLTVGTIWRGRALAEQGQEEEGIAQMRQGLAAYQGAGAEVVVPYFLTILTEAYGKIERVEEGLTVLAEALALVNKSGERWCEAELLQCKGELLLRQAVHDEEQAEACFQQALAEARRQEAKSWELRAATSLSRLWQQQGKPAEARALLAPLYGWFTEGFDTADLQEAKALLEGLSQ